MTRNALLVTGRYKSLGETYTMARFAEGLRQEGWRVHFLAFEFAAGFLRQHDLPLTLLAADLASNHRAFEEAVKADPPDLILTTDYFLLSFREMGLVWSNRWLFEVGCPVVSFDHLNFHPGKRLFKLALHRRFAALSPAFLVARGLAKAVPPPGSVPIAMKPIYGEIEELPAGVVALIRSCPIHDPRPGGDGRKFRFSAAASELRGQRNRTAVRAELGIGVDELLVLAPVGTWAVEVCRDFDIPYYDYYPRLLVRHLGRFPGRTRLLLLSGDLRVDREVHGRLTVECLPSVSFDRMKDLTTAADLFLTDNVSSASLGRAVLCGVPAAALVSSVEAEGVGVGTTFRARFPLSPSMGGVLAEMEARAPGCVFPFAVFPMGLREEMEALFRGNLYSSTFEWLELFDEEPTRHALERLLADGAYRERMKERQMEYRAAVEQLPDAAAIAESVLKQAEVCAWA